MKILVSTMAGDFHAAAVGLELRQRGHDVLELFGEDFPERLTMSASASGTSSLGARSTQAEIDLGSADVVWNRRRIAFTMPLGIHERDKEFVRQELRALSDAVWESAAPDGYWINPHAAAARARHKLEQLAAARRVGLQCPDTLITNSYDDVIRFMQAAPDGRVIYKSMRPAYWGGEDKLRSLMATLVSAEDLQDRDFFQLCPGIFQQFVRKRYEVRLTVFGRTVLALKLNPETSLQSVDCREQYLIPGFPTEVYDVPTALKEQVFAFMDTLGLRFGCIDVAMGEDGAYHFFEVNESGQFLWLEQLQPRLPLLDAFCSFVEACDDRFEYRATTPRARLQDWDPSRIEAAIRPIVEC